MRAMVGELMTIEVWQEALLAYDQGGFSNRLSHSRRDSNRLYDDRSVVRVILGGLVGVLVTV